MTDHDHDGIDFPDVPLSVALVNSNLPIQERLWALEAINERRALRAERDADKKRLRYLSELFKEYDCGTAPIEELGRRVLRAANERDAALARVKEVEKEWGESRAAQRSMISELQAAMCDVFRHLGPPTDRYTPWREQVIAAIDEVTAERDGLKADAERLRGLLQRCRRAVGISAAPELLADLDKELG